MPATDRSTPRSLSPSRGDNSWFFLTKDTVFGASLEGDAAAAVKAGGGTVIGSVRTPTGTTDFSSFLLQAQTSKAKVIGVVEAGADLAAVLKQGEEFGLKAVGSKDPDKVMAKMREMPINDFMSHDARLRVDGRVLRDLYLFEVKSPSESKAPWDYYKQIGVIPPEKAVRPLDQGGCPLVNQ